MRKDVYKKVKRIDEIINDIPNDPLGKYNALTVRNNKKSRKSKGK